MNVLLAVKRIGCPYFKSVLYLLYIDDGFLIGTYRQSVTHIYGSRSIEYNGIRLCLCQFHSLDISRVFNDSIGVICNKSLKIGQRLIGHYHIGIRCIRSLSAMTDPQVKNIGREYTLVSININISP